MINKNNLLRYKVISAIILMVCITSCQSIKIDNSTLCPEIAPQVRDALRSSGLNINDVRITRHRLTKDNSECYGLYEINVNKWKGYTGSTNIIAIPAIKTDQGFYLNLYVANGEVPSWLNEKNINIEKPSMALKRQIIEDNILKLSSEERLEVWNWFSRGVAISGRGRIR